jgi:hypothetical protein
MVSKKRVLLAQKLSSARFTVSRKATELRALASVLLKASTVVDKETLLLSAESSIAAV